MIIPSQSKTEQVDISTLPKEKGVFMASQKPYPSAFASIYLKALEKEHRLYSDAELKELPKSFAYNVHRAEWARRAQSLERFLKYLKRKKSYLYILEVGCGNGWFAEKLAKNQGHQVFGIDVNLPELEQAARIFQMPNLNFFYGDINEDILSLESFDMVILNNSIQYFPDLYEIVRRCMAFSKMGGEVHILDSPIYKPSEIENAKLKTKQYYEEVGFEAIVPYIYHHSTDDLLAFRHQYLYKAGGLKSLWKKKAGACPWIRLIKDEEL